MSVFFWDWGIGFELDYQCKHQKLKTITFQELAQFLGTPFPCCVSRGRGDDNELRPLCAELVRCL